MEHAKHEVYFLTEVIGSGVFQDKRRVGKMPKYVTESGYEESDDERKRVSEAGPLEQQLKLVELATRKVTELSLADLPGIATDPLAELRSAQHLDALKGNRKVRFEAGEQAIHEYLKQHPVTTGDSEIDYVLEGGIEGRPANVVFYATSNRRHLMSRDMMENERSTAINPGEAVEEKVSLSDRFGLWLGFHRCSQDEYLAMVRGYCSHFGIKLADEELEREALEWSTTRGSRSGRVAWQFVQELAGRLGVRLTGK